MPTFAQLFCARHKLTPGQFENAVLSRCLYPQASVVWRFIDWLHPAYFTADRDFIRSVGPMQSLRTFRFESSQFSHHPANRGFARRYLKVRISSGKLYRLIDEHLHADNDQSESDQVVTS